MTSETYREQIAAEIRARMARARISSAYMSERTGIASSTLSLKINGGSPFTTDQLEAIAIVLQVQPSTLLPEMQIVSAA